MSKVIIYNVYQKERAASDDKANFPKYEDWKKSYEAANSSETPTTEKSTKKAAAKPKAKATAKPEKADKEPRVTKASQAVDIYKSMMDGKTHPVRKDVIAAFKQQLNMTNAGASTYWFNVKKKLS